MSPATPSKPPDGDDPPSAVPDVLGPELAVVFCGINPGRVSAAAGAHFANPRNDFWRLLHAAGFTPRVLERDEPAARPLAGVSPEAIRAAFEALIDSREPDAVAEPEAA